MNTIPKKIIRTWIALTSIFAFSMGWAALAHSEKPAPLVPAVETSTTRDIQLAPVPSFEALSQSNQPSPVPSITIRRSIPRLRTGGS